MTCSRSPSTAFGLGVLRVSTTFWLPWSTTKTSSRISSVEGSFDSATSWSLQKSGRLKVVIPMLTRPTCWTVGLDHPLGALERRLTVPASRSNQYQPPSMKGRA